MVFYSALRKSTFSMSQHRCHHASIRSSITMCVRYVWRASQISSVALKGHVAFDDHWDECPIQREFARGTFAFANRRRNHLPQIIIFNLLLHNGHFNRMITNKFLLKFSAVRIEKKKNVYSAVLVIKLWGLGLPMSSHYICDKSKR